MPFDQNKPPPPCPHPTILREALLLLPGLSGHDMTGITSPRSLAPVSEKKNGLLYVYICIHEKVLIKALAACLLDSIWDSGPAYIAASVCTLVEVRACVFLLAPGEGFIQQVAKRSTSRSSTKWLSMHEEGPVFCVTQPRPDVSGTVSRMLTNLATASMCLHDNTPSPIKAL